MKHNTPESMKFKRLMRKLGESKRGVAGLLELLWIVTQNNARRGNIGQFSNEEIAIECDWDGDPDLLVDALVETGWLDVSQEHRLVVHNWPKHAPRYVHAWVKSQSTTFATGDEPTVETVVSTTVGTTEDPIPNQTKPYQTKESSSGRFVPSDGDRSGPPPMSFPVKSKSGSWSLRWSKVDEWAETFGDREWVVGQLRLARQWCIDNPAKQKTSGGMTRFLGSWLTRSNNRSGTGGKPAESESRVATADDLASYNPNDPELR